jgi:hypothetical protein
VEEVDVPVTERCCLDCSRAWGEEARIVSTPTLRRNCNRTYLQNAMEVRKCGLCGGKGARNPKVVAGLQSPSIRGKIFPSLVQKRFGPSNACPCDFFVHTAIRGQEFPKQSASPSESGAKNRKSKRK